MTETYMLEIEIDGVPMRKMLENIPESVIARFIRVEQTELKSILAERVLK